MKVKNKTRDEKGITLVGLIIIIAIFVVIVVIMRWAFGLSEVIKEKTRNHETMDFRQISSSNNK